MDQSIVLALIGIVPAVVASIVTYGVSAKKTKVDLIKLINDSSDALRTEIKLELEECRKDREAIRSELNLYKKENESIKKELEEQKKENSELKNNLNELEIKLDAANDLISKLADSKVSKKKLTK
jgi:septal ring factor EnvC (AmiA/AmiB activator)